MFLVAISAPDTWTPQFVLKMYLFELVLDLSYTPVRNESAGEFDTWKVSSGHQGCGNTLLFVSIMVHSLATAEIQNGRNFPHL